MRYIWIIRHGKAEIGSHLQDRDRALANRGHADGERMQLWLAQQDHPAKWLWLSSAKRTQQTATYVVGAFGTPTSPCVDVEVPELYLAGPETILSHLQQTPPDVDSVAIVGHNPGLSILSSLLDNKLPNSLQPRASNLPTWGIALFSTECDWQDLQYGKCALVTETRPKNL